MHFPAESENVTYVSELLNYTNQKSQALASVCKCARPNPSPSLTVVESNYSAWTDV